MARFVATKNLTTDLDTMSLAQMNLRGILPATLFAFGLPFGAVGQNTFSVQEDHEVKRLLEQARSSQIKSAEGLAVFHGFQFADRFSESGITFVHHMTEDSGKVEKAIHYDHGSGVAVADVDGDGLLDIYFPNQIGGNQLWRNQGGGRFENLTAAAGVSVPGKVSVAAAFADLDNDGDPDLIVTTVRAGNVLFENVGGGKFRDITATAGMESQFHSSGIVVFDFNKDGLLDILITSVGKFTTDVKGAGGYFVGMTNGFSGHLFPDRSEPCLLYRNEGKLKFAEVAKELNLVNTGWSGDANSCDVNEDGYPDLYVLNMQGDDHLFVNLRGTRFEDQTTRYFPKTPWGSMGVAWFDYNLDGKFDLFVTDMHSDMTGGQGRLRRGFNSSVEKAKSEAWCTAQWDEAFLQGSSNNIFGNAFYQNLGGGRFVEVSDKLGTETYWPWGPSVGDVNADGYEDIFVTAGMGYPFAYGINSLLLNVAGGAFQSAEFVLGVEPRRAVRVSKECFTLDCSGEDRNHPLCRGRRGTLSVRASLSTRSAAIFDLDNDGDLDIVTNEFDDSPQVLISDLTDRRKLHFVKVKLVGAKSNRDGLGAVVKLRAGETVMTRYHSGKSGYLAQSQLPLYFGLGETAKANEIQVIWPSGVKQTVTGGIPQNGLAIITEVADSPAAR
jgi:hypothetical protein